MNTGSTNARIRLRASRVSCTNSLRAIAESRVRRIRATSVLPGPAARLDAGDEHVLERGLDPLDAPVAHAAFVEPRAQPPLHVRLAGHGGVHRASEQADRANERCTGERLD